MAKIKPIAYSTGIKVAERLGEATGNCAGDKILKPPCEEISSRKRSIELRISNETCVTFKSCGVFCSKGSPDGILPKTINPSETVKIRVSGSYGINGLIGYKATGCHAVVIYFNDPFLKYFSLQNNTWCIISFDGEVSNTTKVWNYSNDMWIGDGNWHHFNLPNYFKEGVDCMLLGSMSRVKKCTFQVNITEKVVKKDEECKDLSCKNSKGFPNLSQTKNYCNNTGNDVANNDESPIGKDESPIRLDHINADILNKKTTDHLKHSHSASTTIDVHHISDDDQLYNASKQASKKTNTEPLPKFDVNSDSSDKVSENS